MHLTMKECAANFTRYLPVAVAPNFLSRLVQQWRTLVADGWIDYWNFRKFSHVLT